MLNFHRPLQTLLHLWPQGQGILTNSINEPRVAGQVQAYSYFANSTKQSPACDANIRSASQDMPDNASYLVPDKEVYSLVHLQPLFGNKSVLHSRGAYGREENLIQGLVGQSEKKTRL
jgi:hypothetical protein